MGKKIGAAFKKAPQKYSGAKVVGKYQSGPPGWTENPMPSFKKGPSKKDLFEWQYGTSKIKKVPVDPPLPSLPPESVVDVIKEYEGHFYAVNNVVTDFEKSVFCYLISYEVKQNNSGWQHKVLKITPDELTTVLLKDGFDLHTASVSTLFHQYSGFLGPSKPTQKLHDLPQADQVFWSKILFEAGWNKNEVVLDSIKIEHEVYGLSQSVKIAWKESCGAKWAGVLLHKQVFDLMLKGKEPYVGKPTLISATVGVSAKSTAAAFKVMADSFTISGSGMEVFSGGFTKIKIGVDDFKDETEEKQNHVFKVSEDEPFPIGEEGDVVETPNGNWLKTATGWKPAEKAKPPQHVLHGNPQFERTFGFIEDWQYNGKIYGKDECWKLPYWIGNNALEAGAAVELSAEEVAQLTPYEDTFDFEKLVVPEADTVVHDSVHYTVSAISALETKIEDYDSDLSAPEYKPVSIDSSDALAQMIDASTKQIEEMKLEFDAKAVKAFEKYMNTTGKPSKGDIGHSPETGKQMIFDGAKWFAQSEDELEILVPGKKPVKLYVGSVKKGKSAATPFCANKECKLHNYVVTAASDTLSTLSETLITAKYNFPGDYEAPMNKVVHHKRKTVAIPLMGSLMYLKVCEGCGTDLIKMCSKGKSESSLGVGLT